jgi:hypothetical protein
MRASRARNFNHVAISVISASLWSSAVVAANSPRDTTAAVPDFSGIWAHFTFPDVEPPLTGPGPIRNLSQRDGASDPYEFVGDYRSPILKRQAAEVVKQHGDVSRTGRTYPAPSNQCWPGGVPYVFTVNIGMQMFQERNKITIIYTNDHEVRHVRMNAQHPGHLTPSWYGDSVGHYEGETLVIDTVGIKIGPFAMVDLYGTPHTSSLHVIERYRLLDYKAAKEAQERGQRGLSRLGRDPGLAANPDYKGKGLQLEFTVADENVFTTPWSAAISYRRPLGEWPEMACADSTRDYEGRGIDLPHTDKPDF